MPSLDPRARLEAFRRSHRSSREIVGGVEWRFVESGNGSPVVVLPGGLGTAESAYATILELESNFHVFVPTYPSLPSMTALVDGLSALLSARGQAQPHMLGGSYGGLVAQLFASRHPEQVRSLVLSHTAGPDHVAGERARGLLGPLRWLPVSLLRSLLLRRLLGLVRHPATPSAELVFLAEYMRETLGNVRKQELLAALERVVEFQVDSQRKDYAGPVLIVQSDDDPAVRPAQREGLRGRFPQAEVHTFHGTGHLASLLKPDEYYGRVRVFFAAHGARPIASVPPSPAPLASSQAG